MCWMRQGVKTAIAKTPQKFPSHDHFGQQHDLEITSNPPPSASLSLLIFMAGCCEGLSVELTHTAH